MALPYHTIEEFMAALDSMERPLAVIAHQDDEVSFAGTLARCADRLRILWVTNGDGLYFDANVSPLQYGEIRKAEALRSAAALGVSAERTACLDYSEVEIYRRLYYVTQTAEAAAWLRPYFAKMLEDIRARLFEYRPQVVFTCAFQGGNPEHDLTHYFTRVALDEYEKATGEPVPLIHVPMYEYIILVALRFNPFYPGLRWRYLLNDREKEVKRHVVEAYPSQTDLLEHFGRIIGRVGKLSLLTRGKALTIEEYVSEEEYGPVPEDWDYLRNPHAFDKANYIGDHFAGLPVTFDRSVRPIIATFPRPK